MSQGVITRVAGPLIVAEHMGDAAIGGAVRASGRGLIGEIIELRGDCAAIQVYEDTDGIGPGEPVFSSGEPLSVELGPGLIGGLFDGIQRPLPAMRARAGDRIARGVDVPPLDRNVQWRFEPCAVPGGHACGGDVLGTVREGALVVHKIMVPPGVEGELTWLGDGLFAVDQPIARIATRADGEFALTMTQRWPVRRGRPYMEKIAPDGPMHTGLRAIDTFFPIARGGAAAVVGPFGSGKTVLLQRLANGADADVVVFICCGERGSEIAELRANEALMKRAVLIACSADMPIAQREAAIYTGITIAEYYRDMGHHVALIVDSISRWAEAQREVAARLGEMPGDAGYPAALPGRIANFFGRAGRVRCIGSGDRDGAITAIGAVSPPGGDIAEPVSQAMLRAVKVCWQLSRELAHRRHFPAIDWQRSDSQYADPASEALLWLRNEAAQSARDGFLRQDAFDEQGAPTSPDEQRRMLSMMMQRRTEGGM